MFLDDTLVRLTGQAGELNLPWIWRAGPQGGAASGPGVSEVQATPRGVWGRPWRPAHLRARPIAGGFGLSWVGRSRLDVDGWGVEEVSPDPDRYRVRVFDGETIRRVFEIEGGVATYPEADLEVDFPNGIGPDARIGMSQAGGRWDWGVEAVIALSG